MPSSGIEAELRSTIRGEVRFDEMDRHAYAVDASIFEVKPAGIVIPRDKDDIVTALNLARKHNTPIVARGAGTGIAGGCLTRGLVVDTAKQMNRILEVNVEERWAHVEPGVVQDDLNAALAPHGLRLGPDTSTSNRATLGGMVANNASGASALKWGATVDHLLAVEMILSSGKTLYLDATTPHPVVELAKEYASLIPRVGKNSGGYLLDKVGDNPARIVAGSEGTLGILTEIRVALVEIGPPTIMGVWSYESVDAATKEVPRLLKGKPHTLEMIDRTMIELGRLSPSMRGKLDWLEGEPGALLIGEFEQKIPSGGRTVAEKGHVWALRKAGVGLLMSRRAYSRAVAFIEDVAVPVKSLGSFLKELQETLSRYGREAGIYGHVGLGALHVRPFFDLRKKTEVKEMVHLMEEVSRCVGKYGGTLTAEHGDGLIRSWLCPPELREVFSQVKQLFDPDDLMSPGLVTGTPLPLENIRKGPQKSIETVFDWDREGGFELSVDMCNGNGRCRKKTGIMCPSFHAYGDEYHTTRARAQGLRALLHGDVDFKSDELHDVLKYCLSCKGCKTECPSQVDMAKMKSEFLHKYGWNVRDWIFGHASLINRLGSLTAPLSNWLPKGWLLGTDRPLPPFSRRRFSKKVSKGRGEQRVVLLSDTFAEFNHPQIGHAAWQLLTDLGFHVIVPPYRCCGRPLISKGFLTEAQRTGRRLIAQLLPYAEEGLPIIGLEPSCLSALTDDLTDLVDDAETVAEKCLTLEEFLLRHVDRLPAPSSPTDLFVHVHCHQKALSGTQSTLELIEALPQTQGKILQAGCCGMAGSFGYENPEFGLAVGESQLFPQVRELPEGAVLIASGTSCRSQIEFATQKKPIHLAEWLLSQMVTA